MANKSISLVELAKNSGVSTSTICRIQRGKGENSPATVGKIAKALNCDVRELLEDSPSYYDEQQAIKDSLNANLEEILQNFEQ